MTDKINNNLIRISNRMRLRPRGKQGIWTAEFWHDGEHRRQSMKTSQRKHAVELAKKLDAELTLGTYKKHQQSPRIKDILTEYYAYLVAEDRAPKTISQYRCHLTTFLEIAGKARVSRLNQITHRLFDQYVAACRVDHEAKTVSNYVGSVRRFLAWCLERDHVETNPLAKRKGLRVPPKPKGLLSLTNVNAILEKLAEPERTHVACLAFTGMRSGDLRQLRPRDVDLDGNWLHIVSRVDAKTKTRQIRKLPIHARLMPILHGVPKSQRDWFFTAPKGKRYPQGGNWIHTGRLNDKFVEILKELGLPAGRKTECGFVLHSLRTFFKSFCINNGVPREVVDRWQGHAGDRSVALTYYVLSEEDSQRWMKSVPFGTGKPAADAGDRKVV